METTQISINNFKGYEGNIKTPDEFLDDYFENKQ